MSRLVNRQRQLAEQGRLRLGYTVPGERRPRPVRSETWVVTSHSEDYVARAAELWGGEVHQWQPQGHGTPQRRGITQAKQIDAILPPGEPLMQAYEMWSAGGCQRRCDGATEQFTGSPCLCIGKFGDKWYEQAKGVVCDTVSRLKVILPDMPGMGSWRVDTGSFYAADEMAGMIEVIRATVGDRELIPVRLRIEPRTSTNGGQTKQFVVPVLELRGVTAGELLGGRFGGIASVEGAREQKALGAAAIPDYVAQAEKATTLQQVQQIWQQAEAAGHLDPIRDRLFAIGQKLNTSLAAPAATEPPQPQPDLDPDMVWLDIMRVSGSLGMTESQVLEDFPNHTGGVLPDDADGADMNRYLEYLQTKVQS